MKNYLMVLAGLACAAAGLCCEKKPTEPVVDSRITWEQIAPLKESRYRAQCEVLNNRLYCMGGMSNYIALNTVASYQSCDWVALPASMSVGRYEFASSVLNGRIYVFGGYSSLSEVTKTVESFDGETWRSEAEMPTPLHDCAAAVIGDSIYIFGGIRNASGTYEYCDRVWRFCPTAPEPWRGVCTLPAHGQSTGRLTQRGGYRCVSKGPYIYVIGGAYATTSKSLLKEREYFSDVWIFDPSADTAEQWQRSISLPDGRVDFACVYVGENLYVIGGQARSLQHQIEVFHAGKWNGYESTEPLPEPSFAVLSNRIYVVGGSYPYVHCFSSAGMTGTTHPLMKDLLAFYPFNGTADDASRNGRNAMGSTSSSFVEGRSVCTGKAYHLTGRGSELTLPASIKITGDLSVSFWMKTSQSDPDNWPSGTFIIDRDVCGETSDWSIGLGAGGKLQFNTGVRGTDYVLTSRVNVNDVVWHHIVVVRDVGGRSKVIYIDGVLDVSTSFFGQPLLNNSDPIYIGASVCLPTTHDYYVGDIDDVRIYGRTLNADDVRQLYLTPD